MISHIQTQQFPIKFISLALFLMVALGTIIGLIPAQRAVSIKPIDALEE